MEKYGILETNRNKLKSQLSAASWIQRFLVLMQKKVSFSPRRLAVVDYGSLYQTRLIFFWGKTWNIKVYRHKDAANTHFIRLILQLIAKQQETLHSKNPTKPILAPELFQLASHFSPTYPFTSSLPAWTNKTSQRTLINSSLQVSAHFHPFSRTQGKLKLPRLSLNSLMRNCFGRKTFMLSHRLNNKNDFFSHSLRRLHLFLHQQENVIIPKWISEQVNVSFHFVFASQKYTECLIVRSFFGE